MPLEPCERIIFVAIDEASRAVEMERTNDLYRTEQSRRNGYGRERGPSANTPPLPQMKTRQPCAVNQPDDRPFCKIP